MSEPLHCHSESFISSMTETFFDKLSVPRKVRGLSKICNVFF